MNCANKMLFFCYFSFCESEIPAVKDRRDGGGHDKGDGHADKGHRAERVHSRMLCEDENADADEHDGRRKDNRLTVLREHFFAGAVLVHKTFDNENRIVVTLTEDKRGEDDIDDIELNTKQLHDGDDPNPTECHGHKSNQRQPEIAEAEHQEKEHNQAAAQTDIIEVIA